jgi:basic membrane lipoprotein Med (substrate-binding protein (PBP1-ABC) superfamily)
LTIKRLKAGKFHAGNTIFSIKNGATGFATDTHHVPASIKAAAQKAAGQLKAGKFKVSPTCSLGKK